MTVKNTGTAPFTLLYEDQHSVERWPALPSDEPCPSPVFGLPIAVSGQPATGIDFRDGDALVATNMTFVGRPGRLHGFVRGLATRFCLACDPLPVSKIDRDLVVLVAEQHDPIADFMRACIGAPARLSVIPFRVFAPVRLTAPRLATVRTDESDWKRFAEAWGAN